MKKILSIVLFFVLISSVNANIQDQIDEGKEILQDYLSGVPRENIVVVTGSKLSVEEKIIFNMIKGKVSQLQGIQIYIDSYVESHPEITKGKTMVLIGSSKTNKLSTDKGELINLDQIHILKREDSISIYTSREEVKAENLRISNSPFNGIIPEEYIPVAASITGLFMLYIWSLISKTVLSAFNDIISSRITSRKTSVLALPIADSF